MSKSNGNRFQSVLWYAITFIYALIAIASWLKGESGEMKEAMTHFGIAFILANHLRASVGDGEKWRKVVYY